MKSLFLEDIEQHYTNLQAYRLPVVLLPRENENERPVAPLTAVLENLATRHTNRAAKRLPGAVITPGFDNPLRFIDA